MKTVAFVLVSFCFVATTAMADDSCKIQAASKNLPVPL